MGRCSVRQTKPDPDEELPVYQQLYRILIVLQCFYVCVCAFVKLAIREANSAPLDLCLLVGTAVLCTFRFADGDTHVCETPTSRFLVQKIANGWPVTRVALPRECLRSTPTSIWFPMNSTMQVQNLPCASVLCRRTKSTSFDVVD